MPGPTPDDRSDPILERLRESATGDAAVRQLRRRYDILRQDYESLIDRLMELEERVAEDTLRREAEAMEHIEPSPVAIAGEPMTVAESLLAPILRLRDEYLLASTGLQGIISGLDNLASGVFSRQRPQRGSESAYSAPPAPPAPEPAPPPTSDPLASTTAAGNDQPFQVDVRGQGFGELLDFQERLTHLPGVARVSISAIDNERATLVVELDDPS